MAEDQTVEMVSEIVSSFVTNNAVAVENLPELIRSVYGALTGLGQPLPEVTEELPKLTPAQIRKSIRPDALVSFEDGREYKTLKRHLTKRGLTMEGYKAKWGLPTDYPAVAPDYSARRSEMAKSLGLGRNAKDNEKPVKKQRGRAKQTARSE
jgi:predicted transcriptional regulator